MTFGLETSVAFWKGQIGRFRYSRGRIGRVSSKRLVAVL